MHLLLLCVFGQYSRSVLPDVKCVLFQLYSFIIRKSLHCLLPTVPTIVFVCLMLKDVSSLHVLSIFWYVSLFLSAYVSPQLHVSNVSKDKSRFFTLYVYCSKRKDVCVFGFFTFLLSKSQLFSLNRNIMWGIFISVIWCQNSV